MALLLPDILFVWYQLMQLNKNNYFTIWELERVGKYSIIFRNTIKTKGINRKTFADNKEIQ